MAASVSLRGKRRSVPKAASTRTRSNRSATSAWSKMANDESTPTTEPCCRSNRLATAWNVPPQTRPAAEPASALARASISAAARRENVSKRMRSGLTPDATRRATRAVNVRVFPVPAAATIRSGPSSWATASRCPSFRPSRVANMCSLLYPTSPRAMSSDGVAPRCRGESGDVGLEQIAQGVYVWLQLPGGLGHANAGVVVDEDGVTVIDTLMVPSQSEELSAAVAAMGRPVRRVVLTSGHIEFAGGTSRFPLAAVYGSAVTSMQLDQPPNLAAYQRFMPDEFGAEFTDLETRRVTHVVDGPVMLTPAVEVIPVAGYTPANLVVLVPAAGVLFAGGMCAFGVTPLGFQADLAAWADALDTLAASAPVGVPGHGPVGGEQEVRGCQGYLRACLAANGDPAALDP